MTTDLDSFIRKSKSLFVEFKDQSIKLLRSELETIFENNPEVKAIRWEQWTPHFNDGDPCEFMILEAKVSFDGEAFEECYYSGENISDQLYLNIRSFNEKLWQLESFLEKTFGQATIKATRDSKNTLEVTDAPEHY